MKTRPTDDVDPLAVETAERRLEEVGELIEATNDDRDALYDERRVLVARLRAAGVGRERLAQLARTSVGMIKIVIAEQRAPSGTR